jgi:hypothetical protein
MTRLILLTGLPGTGKSTLAQHIGRTLKIPVFSRDGFESRLYTEGLTDGHSVQGYLLLLDTIRKQLELGVSCVADAVFPLPGFRDELRNAADRYNASFKIIHSVCSNADLHQQRLTDRSVAVPWPPPDWDEVQRLRAMYTPWPDGSVLRVDAVNPLNDNLTRVYDYLQS